MSKEKHIPNKVINEPKIKVKTMFLLYVLSTVKVDKVLNTFLLYILLRKLAKKSLYILKNLVRIKFLNRIVIVEVK